MAGVPVFETLGFDFEQALLEAGIPVLGDRREGLMHNKFVIIDRQEVWTGSVNFTVSDKRSWDAWLPSATLRFEPNGDMIALVRREAPLFRWEQLHLWCVARHADVNALLRARSIRFAEGRSRITPASRSLDNAARSRERDSR